MAISVLSETVAGTDCPWALGSGSNNPGTAGTIVPYNTGNWDGSQANSGPAGQNASFPYGRSHTHAGETGPQIITGLTPGQLVLLLYGSGTVATQGSGAGNSGPAGSPTTGVTPLPPGGCDTDTMPTNVIKGFNGINANGTCNTSGTTVTWASGTLFSPGMVGGTIWINNAAFVIASVSSSASTTTLTTATSVGTLTGATFIYWAAATSIGGLVGAFTDSSGNVKSQFDWAGWKGITPPSAFTLTSCGQSGTAGQTFAGTITGGGTNFEGFWVQIAGFTNSVNNGIFWCTGSTTSQIYCANWAGVAETHAGTATVLSFIQLTVPPGATQLQLGINDTQLFDNTGSFVMTAFVMDTTANLSVLNGGKPTFKHFPNGVSGVAGAFQPDNYTDLGSTVFMAGFPIYQGVGNSLSKLLSGQLWPRGAQNTGGNPPGTGQNFPY